MDRIYIYPAEKLKKMGRVIVTFRLNPSTHPPDGNGYRVTRVRRPVFQDILLHGHPFLKM